LAEDVKDKPPFGFRQDRENLPEPPEGTERTEVSCTSLHESLADAKTPWVPAAAGDYRHWWYYW
jgi:hypothetical protein